MVLFLAYGVRCFSLMSDRRLYALELLSVQNDVFDSVSLQDMNNFYEENAI